MFRSTFFRLLIVAAVASSLSAVAASAQDAPGSTVAAENGPTALTNDGSAVASLARVERTGDSLTLRVRFTRAEGVDRLNKTIYSTLSKQIWESDIYVTAGDKKYLLLVDSSDKPIASSTLRLTSGGPQAGAWYGTFPAPPAGERATLYLPDMEPLGPFEVPE